MERLSRWSAAVRLNKVPPGLSWPNALYVPGNQRSFASQNRQPIICTVSREYTGHLSSASTDRRGVPASRGETTERGEIGEAGIGILPQNTLSYVRFEPDGDCAVTYRTYKGTSGPISSPEIPAR